MEPIRITLETPLTSTPDRRKKGPTLCPRSPSKSELDRSESLLQKVLHPRLMKQERLHSQSKRPLVRFSGEADLKIQELLGQTQALKATFCRLQEQLQALEGKVDKLELEYENGQKHHLIRQLSYTPEKGGGKGTKGGSSTPVLSLKVSSVLMSPASPNDPPVSYALMEYGRKRGLLEICLTRLLGQLKAEVISPLQSLFQENFSVLKFRRAECCVLGMVKLQRKLKLFEVEVCGLRDRLLHIQTGSSNKGK